MNMIAKSAAVVAVARATITPALADPKVSPALSPARDEPTVIERLWIEAQAATREYEINRKQCDKLEKVLEREMPDPDPSIVFGNPDNAADGLAYWMPDREPPYFKHYIFSRWLEGKLEAANEPTLAKVTRRAKGKNGSKRITIESQETGDAPFPVTQEQLALRERLARRLELSRQYEQQKERVSRKIGLTAAEKRRDQACGRQVKLLNKILRLPASTRSEFGIKLAIYKEWLNNAETAEMIMRDIDRLVKLPQSFARAWGFDPNAPAILPAGV